MPALPPAKKQVNRCGIYLRDLGLAIADDRESSISGRLSASGSSRPRLWVSWPSPRLPGPLSPPSGNVFSRQRPDSEAMESRQPPNGSRSASGDEALLAELAAPPDRATIDDALAFWTRRLADLPARKRAERREAQTMIDTWTQRRREADPARYGPGIVEQLLSAAGISWRPRRLLAIAGLAGLAVLLSLVAIVIAVVVFWSDIEPIVRFLWGGGG